MSHIKASFALIASLQGIRQPPDASCVESSMSSVSCPRCLRSVPSYGGFGPRQPFSLLRGQQFPQPGVLGFADPVAAADVAESFCECVVDDGVAIGAIAKIGTRERVHVAVAVADEDAV